MTLAALVVLTLFTPQDPPPILKLSGGPKPVVALRITVDGASPVTIRVRASERATIKIGEQAPVALTPQVQATSLDLVLTQVTDADTATPPDEGTAPLGPELERVRLEPGTAVRVSASAFSIEWIGLEDGVSAGVPPPEAPCRNCCLYCAGTLYCACSVETICGSCCCEDCCTSAPRKDGDGAISTVCAARRMD